MESDAEGYVLEEIDVVGQKRPVRHARECPYHDIDLVYSRIREQESSLSSTTARVSTGEVRCATLDQSVAELKSDMTQVRDTLDVHTRHYQSIMSSLESHRQQQIENTDLIASQGRVLVQHTVEEAQRQMEQTAAIQKLTRTILMLFAAIGSMMLLVSGLFGENTTLMKMVGGLIGG